MSNVTKGEFKLKLEPDAKVVFNGPFNRETRAALKLTNGDDKARAFKVKCTSNAIFKIRPAVGFLDKGASTTISLTCKKLDADVPADNYHLFSVYHIKSDEKTARKAWQDHKGEPEGSKRLPVVFVGGGDDKKKDDDKKKSDKKDDDKKDDDKKEDKKEEDKKEDDKKKSDKKEDKEDKKDDEKKDD